jgi:hypothetical protein
MLIVETGIRYYQVNPGDTCQGIVNSYSNTLSMDELSVTESDPGIWRESMADVTPVFSTTHRPTRRTVAGSI